MLANCVVGLGFSYRGFQLGLAMGPDMIGCDAGSADMGPVYLGSGLDPKSTLSLERDLRIMIEGAHSIGVPLVIGSCGGAGGEPHLDGFRHLVDEIAGHLGIHLRVALIHAEQDAASLHAALDAGRIRPLGPFAELTHHAIDESAAVVAMMGAGPLVDALGEVPDVILAGRCADPAIFAPTALLAGRPPGPAWHAAKSVDKGYLATATPREGSPVLATVTDDSFVIEPTKPGVVCTVDSVARMTMHENPNPFVVTQPSGDLVTGDARYEQLEGGRVRVTGSRFRPAAATVGQAGGCPSRRLPRHLARRHPRPPAARLSRRLPGFLPDPPGAHRSQPADRPAELERPIPQLRPRRRAWRARTRTRPAAARGGADRGRGSRNPGAGDRPGQPGRSNRLSV